MPEREGQLHINPYFQPFINPGASISPDVIIEVKSTIPEYCHHAPVIFKPPRNTFLDNFAWDTSWEIRKHQDQYLVVSYSSIEHNEIYGIASFVPETNRWKVYLKDFHKSSDPFAYPLGTLILYYITIQNSGIMVHASGIAIQDGGMIFSGFSGTGKTTMSDIWRQEGYQIINDDRLIIRKRGKDFFMYNSPMTYMDDPRHCKLTHIFLLKQSKENYSKRLSGTNALARFMAFVIQHNYDKQIIAKPLNTIKEIQASLPIHELGFYPDAEITKYINSHYFEDHR